MTTDASPNANFQAKRFVCRCCFRKSGTFSFIYCDKSAVVFSKGNTKPRLPTAWRMRGCDIQTKQTFCSADTLLFLSCQIGSSAAPPRARRRCVCVLLWVVLFVLPSLGLFFSCDRAVVAVSPAHVLAVSIHYEIYLPGQTSPAARRTCRHPLLNESGFQH